MGLRLPPWAGMVLEAADRAVPPLTLAGISPAVAPGRRAPQPRRAESRSRVSPSSAWRVPSASSGSSPGALEQLTWARSGSGWESSGSHAPPTSSSGGSERGRVEAEGQLPLGKTTSVVDDHIDKVARRNGGLKRTGRHPRVSAADKRRDDVVARRQDDEKAPIASRPDHPFRPSRSGTDQDPRSCWSVPDGAAALRRGTVDAALDVDEDGPMETRRVRIKIRIRRIRWRVSARGQGPRSSRQDGN